MASTIHHLITLPVLEHHTYRIGKNLGSITHTHPESHLLFTHTDHKVLEVLFSPSCVFTPRLRNFVQQKVVYPFTPPSYRSFSLLFPFWAAE